MNNSNRHVNGVDLNRAANIVDNEALSFCGSRDRSSSDREQLADLSTSRGHGSELEATNLLVMRYDRDCILYATYDLHEESAEH